MGRQIDPKLAKQIKKDSEKKEKDKKKEDKAKAEQAEKDRILLLQRVLAIETTHQNFVKEITKVGCLFLLFFFFRNLMFFL